MKSDGSTPAEIDWGASQTGAAMVFGLLGRILFSYPERDWLQPIFGHGLFEEVPFAGGQPDVAAALRLLSTWERHHPDQIDDSTVEELRADYTRLFIGPNRVLAPPWESVHRSVDRLLFQEQTLQVREWFRRFGLETVNLHTEPDDHVGLELGFLSHLASSAAEAVQNRDEAAVSRLLEAERAFLAEHPVNWVPKWAELVVREAQTDWYRGVALLSRGALSELATLLEVTVPAWELDQI